MNVILYTPELEPINVIWLPIAVQRAAKQHGFGTITVRNPTGEILGKILIKVLIRADVYNNPVTFFYTEQEELALLLPPAFLPGQTAIMRDTLKSIRKLRTEINKLK